MKIPSKKKKRVFRKSYLKEKLRERKKNNDTVIIINFCTNLFAILSIGVRSTTVFPPRGAREITLILDGTEGRFDLRGTSRLCPRLS